VRQKSHTPATGLAILAKHFVFDNTPSAARYDMARILWVEKQIDYEPQGLMSMSAVLKEAGHEVALTIAAQEDPVQVAEEYQPDRDAKATDRF
jgi:hypothetical protein